MMTAIISLVSLFFFLLVLRFLIKITREQNKQHKIAVNKLLDRIKREARIADTEYLKNMIRKKGFDKDAKRVIQQELNIREGLN